MKKTIYIGSQNYDFQHSLYKPLIESTLSDRFDFIFPSKKMYEKSDVKNVLKSCDLMIAEVSYPTIPLGIEMGWADIYKVPVVCIYLKGTALSSHLNLTCDTFIEYTDNEELLEKLRQKLSDLIYAEPLENVKYKI